MRVKFQVSSAVTHCKLPWLGRGILLVLLVSSFPGMAREASPPEGQGSDQIHDFTIEDLLDIDLSGRAVMELNLEERPELSNPNGLSNLEVSHSIEVMDSSSMKARDMRSLDQAADNLVGVLSGETPADPYSFSMRGFTGNAIKLLYDGVSMGPSTFNMRPQSTHTLERIEIAKGPVALEGGGSSGGAINFVTKTAKLGMKNRTDLETTAGNYGQLGINLGTEGAFSKDSGFLAAISATGRQGWVDDTASEAQNASLSYVQALGPNKVLILAFNYSSDELPAYWGTPLIPRSLARNPLKNVVETQDDRVLDRAIRFKNYNVADHEISSTSLWSRVGLEWQPSSQTKLETIVYHFGADRFWKNAESYSFDELSGRIGRDRLLVEHDRSILGLVSRWHSDAYLRTMLNRYSVSFEYQQNDFKRRVGFDPNVEGPVDQVDLDAPASGVFGEVPKRNDDISIASRAAIFQDDLHLTQDLIASAAFRVWNLAVDKNRFDFEGRLVRRSSLKDDWWLNSARAGLSYRVTPGVRIYGERSWQPEAAETEFMDSYYDVGYYRPSKIVQDEIGLKLATTSRQFEWTVAAYRIGKEAYAQQQDQERQYNLQHARGIETAFKYMPSDILRLGGNLAVVKSRFDESWDQYTGTDRSHKTPINVPPVLANLWLSVMPIPDVDFELGGGGTSVGKRFADPLNTVTLSPYTLYSAFVAYNYRQYRAAFHVQNLTDVVYAPWSDPTYPNQISIGPPRTFNLSLAARL